MKASDYPCVKTTEVYMVWYEFLIDLLVRCVKEMRSILVTIHLFDIRDRITYRGTSKHVNNALIIILVMNQMLQVLEQSLLWMNGMDSLVQGMNSHGMEDSVLMWWLQMEVIVVLLTLMYQLLEWMIHSWFYLQGIVRLQLFGDWESRVWILESINLSRSEIRSLNQEKWIQFTLIIIGIHRRRNLWKNRGEVFALWVCGTTYRIIIIICFVKQILNLDQ